MPGKTPYPAKGTLRARRSRARRKAGVVERRWEVLAEDAPAADAAVAPYAARARAALAAVEGDGEGG